MEKANPLGEMFSVGKVNDKPVFCFTLHFGGLFSSVLSKIAEGANMMSLYLTYDYIGRKKALTNKGRLYTPLSYSPDGAYLLLEKGLRIYKNNIL